MSYLDEVNASLARYAEHRIDPGGFLSAVLANDLYTALGRADEVSLANLVPIAQAVDRLPRACRGSHAAVRMWLANELQPI